MRRRMTMLGLTALLASLSLTTPLAAATGRSTRNSGRKPPVDRGPAETRAERDKRLQRECRGKPNAGACEGYAN